MKRVDQNQETRLATLSEEPINEDEDNMIKIKHRRNTNNSLVLTSNNNNKKKINDNGGGRIQTWRNWIKSQFYFNKKSHLKILLSVLGSPLFPVSLVPKHPHHQLPSIHQVSSSAEYIIQHFTAATGCRKLEGTVKNMYATGKVTMAMLEDLGSNGSSTPTAAAAGNLEKGCFVIWQMVPDKWLIELVVGGRKVVAGSDGNIAWRHTPWLGSHAAKGGVRPLRRALQGLDPMAISAVFSIAQYVGEKHISGEHCFILKLSADHTNLAERSDNTAEMIKHVMFGYFSQRSGLLVYLEDSYLTRIQVPGSHPTYWETTMGTKIEDYRMAEGVKIAHSGHSSVIITRFGDNLKDGPVITRMEEEWTIDDIAFNVPGLSIDYFIPPEEMLKDFPDEALNCRSQLPQSSFPS